MSDENKVRDATDAVKGLVEAVPVYEDVLQPAAKEVGAGLQTIAKTIHIALAPVSALVWGYEKLKDYLEVRLTEKLKNIPPEKIIPPNPTVAVPVVESMRYTAHDPTLRELYSSLLASAMNSDTADNAHPAFVEMIRQMTPEEAKILKFIVERRGLYSFSVITYVVRGETVVFDGNGYRNIAEAAGAKEDQSPSSIENLDRLKLIKITDKLHPVFMTLGPSREMTSAPPGQQELYMIRWARRGKRVSARTGGGADSPCQTFDNTDDSVPGTGRTDVIRKTVLPRLRAGLNKACPLPTQARD
jgi:hypothetical protein